MRVCIRSYVCAALGQSFLFGLGFAELVIFSGLKGTRLSGRSPRLSAPGAPSHSSWGKAWLTVCCNPTFYIKDETLFLLMDENVRTGCLKQQ